MGRFKPAFEEVQATLEAGGCAVVYRELLSDGLTPVTAFRKLHSAGPGFLFESVVGGEKVGRYSFLSVEPFLHFEAYGARVRLRDSARATVREWESDDPIDALRRLVDEFRLEHVSSLPRFLGGAVGYASYDAARYVEHLPKAPPDDRGLPDLCFGFYDRMVIFDHIRKTILIVALVRPAGSTEPSSAARDQYEDACRIVDSLVARLSAPGGELPPIDIDTSGPLERTFLSNFSRAEYEAVVRRCQEYIKAGDIFQVVPSQRFTVETRAQPFDIYRVLRVVNPSPFLFYLPFEEFSLIGSSPEILVRVEDGIVTIRPVAGTRKRGRDEAEDKALADELLADPKERAEHIMLVDLGRNDVGRVAERGSVEISELMVVERYSHVMHITSNVNGRLAPGHNAFDALRAGLPAGTVSGAPKVRAMEIIDEVEPQRRGPYAGAVGYVDFSGNMDTCIALRTIVLKGNHAYVQAGAGIVYDSDPPTEYEETVNKARAVLKAIEVAETQLTPTTDGPRT